MAKARSNKPTHQSQLDKAKQMQRDKIARHFRSGSWFRFRRDLTDALTLEEALLWNFLADHEAYCLAEARHEGWFYCTAEVIEKELHLHPRKQTYLFNNLRKKKVLKTKRMGMPAMRYIWLDYQRVDRIGDRYWEARDE